MHTSTNVSGWWRTPATFAPYLSAVVRAAMLLDGRLTTLTSCAVRTESALQVDAGHDPALTADADVHACCV